MGAARGDRGQPFRALAPVEIISSGVRAPAGMAVDASDAILVADGKAGTLTRIDRSGNRRLLIDGLQRPTGVAVEADGSVLVLEHNGQRLLRLSLDGALTIAAPSLRHARAVAVGPDGRVWVVTRRAGSRGRDDKEKGRRSGESARVALDLESDGTADYEGATLAEQAFAYTRPGIYVATLRVTSLDGQVAAYRAAVHVYDRSALDSRLQAAWRGFKDALRSGDVAGAVTFIHSDRRAGWEEYFLQFSPVQFAAIDSVFTDLALLEVAPDRAECEMMRDVDGLLYSFPVSLLIDVDGRWRLWQF